jgi:hypothetical protein
MLEHAISGKIITQTWHRDTWWLINNGPNALTVGEFNRVILGVNRLIIGTHDKVTVPGWKAQANWSGLPWDVLYTKAAAQDDRLAAFMFGLMCQYAFIHHEAHWYTDQTTYAGRDFPNTYYFQKGALGR